MFVLCVCVCVLFKSPSLGLVTVVGDLVSGPLPVPRPGCPGDHVGSLGVWKLQRGTGKVVTSGGPRGEGVLITQGE